MPFDSNNYDHNDIALIKKQLKCKDIYISGIFKRCGYGFPQIVFLNPVKEIRGLCYLNYEAISNIMWLTCPYLNKEIHELENASYIKKIKTLIQKNCSFKDMMLKAHANYYFLRNRIFRKYLNHFSGKEMDLFKNGIGGIRDLSSIKCLHLHFCHYNLCRDNIAGLITFHLLQKKTDCDEHFCRLS